MGCPGRLGCGGRGPPVDGAWSPIAKGRPGAFLSDRPSRCGAARLSRPGAPRNLAEFPCDEQRRSLIAFVAPVEATTRLYVRDMETGVTEDLEGTDGAYSPFFSSDNQWVGFFTGSDLKKVQLDGGQVVPLADAPDISVGGVWLSDDRVLYGFDQGSKLLTVPAAGGEPDTLYSRSGTWFFAASPVPGEEWVVGSFLSGQLAALSLVDGEVFAITRDGLVDPDSVSAGELLIGSDPQYVQSGHIVYLSNGDGGLEALPFDGRTMEVLGDPAPILTGVRKEEAFGFGHFAVSHDGVLVYAPGVNAHLGYLALVGRPEEPVDTLLFLRDNYSHLELSRDGTQLFANVRVERGHRYETKRFDLVRQSAETLDTGLDQPSGLFLLPGEERILIIRQHPVTMAFEELLEHSLVDGMRRTVTDETAWWLTIHPDGTEFVASSDDNRLRVFPLSGGQPRDLTGGWSPAFSPDGNWLASSGGTPASVRVTPYPEASRNIVVTEGVVEQPFWSRDGSELYYRGVREFFRLSFSPTGGPGGGPSLGDEELAAAGPFVRVLGKSHALAQDGRFLVVLGPPEQPTPYLEVVTGFFTVLERLAPASR